MLMRGHLTSNHKARASMSFKPTITSPRVARAQRELGAKFDLRAFHDAVQDQAPLPLDVLEGRLMLGLRRGSEGVVGAGDLRRLLPGWPSFWRNQPLTREDRETTDWLEQMKNMPDKS